MSQENTDLPFGDAFSPKQLDTGDDRRPLPVILDMVNKYEGDESGFDEAVRSKFFPEDDGTRAKNVRLGLKPNGYGIVDDGFTFTDVGRDLHALKSAPSELHNRFAQHILQSLHGLKGIEIINDLQSQGKKTTNSNIKQEFRDQYGFHIDETSNHWSQMRAWLAEADIINTGTSNYEINQSKLEKLVGIKSNDIVKLDSLTEEQQAFLRALALTNPQEEIENSIVRKIAENAYNVDIDQSGISKKTLEPLQKAGYIEWVHVDGKPNLVETTNKFDSEVLKPILNDLAQRTGVPRAAIRKSYSELLTDITTGDARSQDVALEILAIKIGRTLGLEFVGWRVKGRSTGGVKVDVLFDDVGPLFNRVQIQCYNGSQPIGPELIAQEVGVSEMLRTNTILFVTRDDVSPRAKEFSNRLMNDKNLSIMFLTGETLKKLDEQTDYLLKVLGQEAQRVSQAKQLERGDGPSLTPKDSLEEYLVESTSGEKEEGIDLTYFSEQS